MHLFISALFGKTFYPNFHDRALYGDAMLVPFGGTSSNKK